MMHRFEFCTRFAKGKTLDCGCADASGWKYPIPQDSITNPPNITSLTLVDCDEWKNDMNIPFIRAFAEDVPLPDQSVDTTILGDLLEHVSNPNIVLQEAKRLSRDRIIISVPLEFEWEQNNPNIKCFETREKHIANGTDMRKLSDEQTTGHPSNMCIDAINDTNFAHIHHQRFFTEKTFKELINKNFEKNIWEYSIFKLRYSSLNFVSLGAIIYRKNDIDNTNYNIMTNRLDIVIE